MDYKLPRSRDNKMLKFLQISTILLILSLTWTHGRYRGRRRQTPPMGSTQVPLFPENVDSNAISLLKVPSNEFCAEMDLQPAYHYVVLPWWYHHCQNMKDKKDKEDDKTMPNLGHYSKILERVKNYKKDHDFGMNIFKRARRGGERVQRI